MLCRKNLKEDEFHQNLGEGDTSKKNRFDDPQQTFCLRFVSYLAYERNRMKKRAAHGSCLWVNVTSKKN